MEESWIIVLLISGALLWCLGGTYNKAFRRFIWPLVCISVMLISEVGLVTSIITALAVMISCVFPYGDRTPVPLRWLVLTAHQSPALVINLWSFPIVLVASFLSIGLFQATKKFGFITHKLWEFSVGFLQAGCIVISILMLN